jgi:RecA-family ATPase
MNIHEYLAPFVGKIVVIRGGDSPDGRSNFPAWEKNRESYLYNGTVTDQNLREVLHDEIIIEFDHDTSKGTDEERRKESEAWIERCQQELVKWNFNFYTTDHQGKSPHIRFRIPGLLNHPIEHSILYKQRMVDALLDDIKFRSDKVRIDSSLYTSKKKLISLEDAPHWKTAWNGNPEKVVFEHRGPFAEVNREHMRILLEDFYRGISHDRKIDMIRIEPDKINMVEMQRLFSLHYVESKRNHFLMAFGGICRRKGLTYDEAKILWGRLLEGGGYTDLVWQIKTTEELGYSWEREPEKVAIYFFIKKLVLGDSEQRELYQRFLNAFAEQTKADESLQYTMPLTDWLRDGVRSPEWLVDRLIPSKGFCVWGGQAGSYKTWVAMHLGLCVASGRDFLGEFEVKQGTVLYIDEENGNILLLNRLQDLIAGLKIPIPDNFVASIFSNVKIDVLASDPALLPLKGAIEKYAPRLVILDSTVRLMRGDENEAKDVRNIFDNLKNLFLSKIDHISFVLLHHTNKAGMPGEMGSLRGSSDFAAAADVVMMFKKYMNSPGAVVSLVKHRYIDTSQFKEFGVSAVKDGETLVGFRYRELSNEDSDSKVVDTQRVILKWLKESEIVMFYKKDVLKFGTSERTVQRALQELVREGVLTQEGKKKPYVLVKECLEGDPVSEESVE